MILKRKQFSTMPRSTKIIAGGLKKLGVKSPLRKALKVQDKMLHGAVKFQNIKTKAILNPGGAVADGVGTVISNPISAASVPTPIPTAAVAYGEKMLKTKTPYGKVTDGLHKVYKGTRLDRLVEDGINSGIQVTSGLGL